MNLMRQIGVSNYQILEGIFPEETAYLAPGQVYLLRCDVDVYESAREVVDWCLPRLSVGGVIVFDDYGFSGCEGVTRICNELRNHRKLFFVHSLNGHAIFCKMR